MRREPLTLCTFCCNDATLVLGLLDSLAQWTVRPDRVLVVDDGSHIPFSVPAGGRHEVRVIRHPENMGFAAAKATALDSAETELVLAMDCDIRLEPGWLAASLPLLDDPELGLVGSNIVTDPGGDAVSRYLKRFSSHEQASGETDFVTGGVWLLRRSAWRAAGGFGSHASRTHEDHALCRNLGRAGYRLLVNPGVTARQVRRLSRFAVVRRHWHWAGGADTRLMSGWDDFLSSVLSFVHKQMERMEWMVAHRESGFVYIELLYLVWAAHMILDHAAGLEGDDTRDRLEVERAGFGRALARVLGPYPGLLGQLDRDAAALGTGFSLGAGPARPAARAASGTNAARSVETWMQVLDWLRVLAPLLAELNRGKAEELVAWERRNPADHSAYEHQAGT